MARSSTPHPLSPSPHGGEGERNEKSFSLSTTWRGGQGVRSFRRRLLAWYKHAARDLPWRRTRDPYRVLVSEFMLQQTQVSRVAEFYPRFLERFPDLGTLARAPARRVREAWDGLGYYARASNLHALARVVRHDLGGTLPDNPEELIKLPGIGRSEEHTSELQSPCNLVCRLLLEKKKGHPAYRRGLPETAQEGVIVEARRH